MAGKETGTTIPEGDTKSEWWVRVVSGAIITWADRMIRTETLGIENLMEAANYVNNGEGGLVVTPNHSSFLDAELMKKVRDQIDGRIKFVILWANKFTGKDEGKYSGTGQEDMKKVKAAGKIGKETARMVGITLEDVPQETSDLAAGRATMKFIEKTAHDTLGSNNVMGVFLEGTRTRNKKLNKGKRAIQMFFRDKEINKKTLILPIAAIGTDDYLPPDRETPNLLAKVTIIYGKPYTHAQAEEEMKQYNLPLEDIMMWHIGQMLPEEKWGEYSEIFQRIRYIQKEGTKQVLT